MSEEIKVPRDQIVKIINETLKDGKYVRESDLATQRETGSGRQPDHTHKPEEFMPPFVKSFKCPDGNCGRIHQNPNFKQADTYCEDCGHPYGTIQDAQKSEKCTNCGSTGPAIFVSRRKSN